MAENQAREERIVERIDSVTKEYEKNHNGELKAEFHNSKARVIAQVESVRGVVDHLSRSNAILNIGSPNLNADPDCTTTTPPFDDVHSFP